MLSNFALYFESSVDYLSMPKFVMHKLPYLYFTAVKPKRLEFLTIFDLFQRCKMQEIPTVQGDDGLKPFFLFWQNLNWQTNPLAMDFGLPFGYPPTIFVSYL